MAGEAEQPGARRAQREDLGDDGPVVVRAGVLAAADPHAPRLFAQVAPRRVGQERLHRRARVADAPLFGLPLGLGGGTRAGAHAVGQAGQVGLGVEDERLLLLVGELVLAEAREQRREPLVDLLEPGPVGGAERGARARQPSGR